LKLFVVETQKKHYAQANSPVTPQQVNLQKELTEIREHYEPESSLESLVKMQSSQELNVQENAKTLKKMNRKTPSISEIDEVQSKP